jgi:hypothetical protein
MKARGTLVALLLPLSLALAACGGDSDSTATDPDASDSSTASDTGSPSEATETTEPSETPSETTPPTPDWPACGDVWVADARLALGYKGCLEGDEAVKADNLSCSSGQRIVRYDDSFFAVAGGTIYETSGPLDKDELYLKKVRTCRG